MADTILDGDLMRAARWRVRSLVSVLLAVMLWITLSIPFSREMPARLWLPVIYWFSGSAVILVLARLWYRGRMTSIAQVCELLGRGEPVVSKIEVMQLSLFYVIPLGHEVRVQIFKGESLLLGFWSEESLHHLKRLLEPVRRPDSPDVELHKATFV